MRIALKISAAALVLATPALAQSDQLPQPTANAVFQNLNVWGYGELYYSRPSKAEGLAVADVRRAVFGLGYRFSDSVVWNSEWEVEHAIASAGDAGEFEIEQFYVDFQAKPWLTVTAGLFLMPFGLINEHHEPTQFYGVQRNFVETEIIPSTWREGGVNLHGDTDFGIGYSIGVVTSTNFRDWEFSQDAPPYQTAFQLETAEPGPLQSTHQELQLADASHGSFYAALSWHRVPGLLVGAAGLTGNAAGPAGALHVSLWEAHARWTPGRLDLAVLYAGGHISNSAAANLANPEATNPIPSAFEGFYAQAAYTVYQDATFKVTPFVRWETYDMGSSYDGSAGPARPDGFPDKSDQVFTAGVNFGITQGVVVKADYQWFANNTSFERLDLGLGLAF